MRLLLYVVLAVALSAAGTVWIIAVHTTALNVLDGNVVPLETIAFVALLGAGFALPFVVLYAILFGGLFFCFRWAPVPGLLAALVASEVTFMLFLIALGAGAAAQLGSYDVTSALFAGVVIVAWCGLAAEMARQIVGDAT